MNNNTQTTMDRRGFLKLSGAGLSGLLLQPTAQAFASASSEDDVAILYDASKCIGCRACERACKECNNLPVEPEPPSDLSAITWNLIQQRKGIALDDQPFFNLQCMHCTDAACVMVCPTGALYKDRRGFVALDEEKCNGCGYCTQFCPFGAPHLKDVNLVTGKAKAGKCIGALRLDWRQKLVDEAKIRVSELKAAGHSGAMLYGEKEAGGLHRLSVLLDEPSAYGLPDDPQVPITLSYVWQKILQPVGSIAFGATLVSSAAAYLITRRTIHMEEVE